MLTGALVGCMTGLVNAVLCYPCGPLGPLCGGFLGALGGGVEALTIPCLSILATLFGGGATGGMCVGLGDIISGCCGTLAI